MQSTDIKYKEKNVAKIYLCLDYDSKTSKDNLVNSLIGNIKNSAIDYAGFTEKKQLQALVTDMVFDHNDNNKISQFNFDKEKILEIIKQSIISCHKVIPSQTTRIFVFPSFRTFIKEKMFGVLGYAPYQNTILIFMNILNKKWPQALTDTIAHEFNHSVFWRFNKCDKFLDVFIFEGLAEHFREYIMNGKQAPWTKVFNVDQSKKILLELKRYWNLKKYETLYQSVFYGDKTYLGWTGYTIGYHIVQSFLKNHKSLDWEKIMKLSPKEIFEKSDFI